MAVSILINGNPGPAIAAAVGDVFALSNADNAGIVAWQWTLVDRPTGSAAVLATPTASTSSLTVDVEGTYIIKLEVNADPAQVTTAAVVLPARIASKSPNAGGANLRYPAATENEEVTSGRGWAEGLNKWLEFINKDQILPRRVAVYTAEVFKGPGRILGQTVTVAGAGTLPRAVAPSAAYADRMPCTIFFEDNTTLNGISYGVLFGPVSTTTDLSGLNVGDPVYVDGSGNVSTSPGAVSQVIGYVITSLPPSKIMFHPTLPALYHGQAPGGFTHALATAEAAGFLSPVLYSKLLSLPDANLIPSLTQAPPAAIGAASSYGTGGAGRTVNYSDHVHAHGNQTSPSMHALATQSAHGFMSSTDKTKLDNIQTAGAVNPTTDSNITYKIIYVRTTGNDTTGTGTIGNPYRTYVRAMKDVPLDIINVRYTIDITGITETLGDGYTFPAVRSNINSGKNDQYYGDYSAIKIYAAPTIVESFVGLTVNTGFGPRNIYKTAQVVGKNWTPNQHAGKLVGFTAVAYATFGMIISNTADTLTYVGSGTVGADCSIFDRSATLTCASAVNINNIGCDIALSHINLQANVIVHDTYLYAQAVMMGNLDMRERAYAKFDRVSLGNIIAYESTELTCTNVICGNINGSGRVVMSIGTINSVTGRDINLASCYLTQFECSSGLSTVTACMLGIVGASSYISAYDQGRLRINDCTLLGDMGIYSLTGADVQLGTMTLDGHACNLYIDDQTSTYDEFNDASSPWYHNISSIRNSTLWA